MNVTVTMPSQAKFTPDEMKRAMADPAFFCSRFVMTFDPRPGVPKPYSPLIPYPYQEELISEVVHAVRHGENVLVEKSRDMGVSWIVLSVILWFWLFEPGFQALLGSYVEDMTDNGLADSLFGKFDIILRYLPFVPEGFDEKKHRTFMSLVNPMNGNVISGQAPTQRFARQGRYTVILMDEAAFWQKPESSFGAAGESSKSIIMVTTPPEEKNFVSALRKSGLIKVLTYHWRRHPLKDEAWYEEQKKKKTKEAIARELDINWEGSITGRYYPEADHIVVGDYPYRPDWPLYVSHDPGHRPDPWAKIWWQTNPETGRIRVIESVERQNMPAAAWGPFYQDGYGHPYPVDSQYPLDEETLAIARKTSQWKRGTHFGDHAGWAANPSDGSSAYSTLSSKFDIFVNTNTKEIDHKSRNLALSYVLSRGIEMDDTPGNRYLLECLKNARYADRGEKSTSEKPREPLHDWTSHLRSAAEYFAVNHVPKEKREEPPAGSFAAELARVRSN